MYLTRIDSSTGMVDIADIKDGVMAIKEFRELIDSEKHGIAAITCVALTVDHETPWKHYDYNERHIKAMREVTGNSTAFNWADDLIQQALIKYETLQYNPIIKEMNFLKEIQHARIIEVEQEEDINKKQALLKKLGEIRHARKEMQSSIDMTEVLSDAPTINGYTLTRLEQKVKNEKSFYHE